MLSSIPLLGILFSVYIYAPIAFFRLGIKNKYNLKRLEDSDKFITFPYYFSRGMVPLLFSFLLTHIYQYLCSIFNFELYESKYELLLIALTSDEKSWKEVILNSNYYYVITFILISALLAYSFSILIRPRYYNGKSRIVRNIYYFFNPPFDEMSFASKLFSTIKQNDKVQIISYTLCSENLLYKGFLKDVHHSKDDDILYYEIRKPMRIKFDPDKDVDDNNFKKFDSELMLISNKDVKNVSFSLEVDNKLVDPNLMSTKITSVSDENNLKEIETFLEEKFK